MKKAINITIGNLVFYIEDDAFAALDSYLQSIKQAFSSLPDSDEVMNDMEARIAEHFQTKKSKATNNAITKADVDNLIVVMGNATDFTEDNEPETRAVREAADKKEKKRRLLRNPDDKMLFGVCSGLGAYFDIDPIIFRIGFVLATILWGWGIIVYIILWLITPEATSTTDKMEMRGKPITVNALKEEVREIAEKHKDDKATVSSFIQRFFDFIGRVLTFIFKKLLPMLGRVLAGIFVGAFGIALIALTFVLTATAFNYNSPYVDLPLYDILGAGTYYTILISVYITALIPLIFLFTLALSAVQKRFIIKKPAGLVMFSVWVIAISVAGASIIHSIPPVQSAVESHPIYAQTTRDFDFTDFTEIKANDHIQINVTTGDEFNITAYGSERAMELLEVTHEGNLLEVSSRSRPLGCFICLLPAKDATLDISLPQITSLTATDVARITTDELTESQIIISTTDVARITTEVSATELLSLSATDASKITVSGQTVLLSTETTDVARIYGTELQSLDATAIAKDASRTTISVSETLDATAHDVARIQYIGNPSVKQTVHDVARVTQLDTD